MPERESLATLSALDLRDGYRAGGFTPTEVLEDVIERLSLLQEPLNVMVTDMFERARMTAREATDAWRRKEPIGPLCGVPVTIKDLIYVRDVRGSAGAPLLQDFVPPADSAPVERLRRAGAILTCKTTTCESGYKLTADSPLTGVTRNPWPSARATGRASARGAGARAP